jgi:hypothetical protein
VYTNTKYQVTSFLQSIYYADMLYKTLLVVIPMELTLLDMELALDGVGLLRDGASTGRAGAVAPPHAEIFYKTPPRYYVVLISKLTCMALSMAVHIHQAA